MKSLIKRIIDARKPGKRIEDPRAFADQVANQIASAFWRSPGRRWTVDGRGIEVTVHIDELANKRLQSYEEEMSFVFCFEDCVYRRVRMGLLDTVKMLKDFQTVTYTGDVIVKAQEVVPWRVPSLEQFLRTP